MAVTLHGASGAIAQRLAILENVQENAVAQIHHQKTAGKTALTWETLWKRSGATQEKSSVANVGHLCWAFIILKRTLYLSWKLACGSVI